MDIRLVEDGRHARASAVLGRAVGDLRDIVALELELARADVRDRARQAATSVALFVSGGVLLALSFAMALFAVVLARGGTPEKAIAAAVMLLSASIGVGALAYKKMPRFVAGPERRPQPKELGSAR